MRYVKWAFVIVVFSSLTSFIEKEKFTTGLTVGHKAPDFKMKDSSNREIKLSNIKSDYILISFWSSYNADSRIKNLELAKYTEKIGKDKLKMVSISYDENQSIFKETSKQDSLFTVLNILDAEGIVSKIYKIYKLNLGFKTYLLDTNLLILDTNLNVNKLSLHLNLKEF